METSDVSVKESKSQRVKESKSQREKNLNEMQGAGFEVGTVVEDLVSVGEEEVVEGILERARVAK